MRIVSPLIMSACSGKARSRSAYEGRSRNPRPKLVATTGWPRRRSSSRREPETSVREGEIDARLDVDHQDPLCGDGVTRSAHSRTADARARRFRRGRFQRPSDSAGICRRPAHGLRAVPWSRTPRSMLDGIRNRSASRFPYRTGRPPAALLDRGEFVMGRDDAPFPVHVAGIEASRWRGIREQTQLRDLAQTFRRDRRNLKPALALGDNEPSDASLLSNSRSVPRSHRTRRVSRRA